MSVADMPLQVVAGALVDATGQVLVAQRPAGKQLAGCWEFPGGKVEDGETRTVALRRELSEELGIDADAIDPHPLISVPRRHGAIHLVLHVHRVRHWHGQPDNREHAALAWRDPSAIDLTALAPADRPVVHALRLPTTYVITPDADASRVRALLGGVMARGDAVVQLRLPSWSTDAVRTLAAAHAEEARHRRVVLMLNGDIEGARRLGPAVGVHLRAGQLMTLRARPLPSDRWVAASCHDRAELRRAGDWADFAVLSPVAPTASHPGVPALGWPAFAARVAEAAVPVYALGGMTPADVQQACDAGGQGVAGIRAFWPEA